MSIINIDYGLYLVTDQEILAGGDLCQAVEGSLRGGVTLVQLREKELSGRDFYRVAVALKELTDKYAVPLLINDRLDIALAVDAAGVHIGQDDLPLPVVRRILGPHKLIGYSVSDIKEAVYGAANGADYLGVGPVYATVTKLTELLPLGKDGLNEIKKTVSIPVVGIGGINIANAGEVMQAGAEGISVVSAILGTPDPEVSARELLHKVRGA